jgi:hypothetical protein
MRSSLQKCAILAATRSHRPLPKANRLCLRYLRSRLSSVRILAIFSSLKFYFRKYTMLLHRMEHETMEFRRQQIDKYLLEIQSPVNGSCQFRREASGRWPIAGKTRYHCTGCTASFHDMAGLQCHVLVKHVSLNSAPKNSPTKQNVTGPFEHQACSSTAARDVKIELDETVFYFSCGSIASMFQLFRL